MSAVSAEGPALCDQACPSHTHAVDSLDCTPGSPSPSDMALERTTTCRVSGSYAATECIAAGPPELLAWLQAEPSHAQTSCASPTTPKLSCSPPMSNNLRAARS